MGYTHYWTIHQPIPEELWKTICTAAAAASVVWRATTGHSIAWESDEPTRACEFGPERIRFNGVGEEGHETFYLTPEATGSHTIEFCKTAEKPYDSLVTAILAIAESTAAGYISVSSDGDRPDWEAGLDIAHLIDPAITIPRAVRGSV
jgi:hypothetical protein